LRATDTRLWTEQVAGYQVRQAVGGRFVSLAERPLARPLAGESVLGWQGRLRPLGGLEDTSVIASAVPLRDVTGRVTGAVGIFLEASQQERVELELSGCMREQRRLLARVAVLERQLADTLGAARVDRSTDVSLSPRQLDILELIGRGRTNREISVELGVSVRTVKTHLEHLFRKLGVAHRTEAAIWAAERRPVSVAQRSLAGSSTPVPD
jgi:DNA-binding CsgD family transcriptional regulator